MIGSSILEHTLKKYLKLTDIGYGVSYSAPKHMGGYTLQLCLIATANMLGRKYSYTVMDKIHEKMDPSKPPQQNDTNFPP